MGGSFGKRKMNSSPGPKNSVGLCCRSQQVERELALWRKHLAWKGLERPGSIVQCLMQDNLVLCLNWGMVFFVKKSNIIVPPRIEYVCARHELSHLTEAQSSPGRSVLLSPFNRAKDWDGRGPGAYSRSHLQAGASVCVLPTQGCLTSKPPLFLPPHACLKQTLKDK